MFSTYVTDFNILNVQHRKKKKGGGEFYIKMWKEESMGKQFLEKETRD